MSGSPVRRARWAGALLASVALSASVRADTVASLLGNFTINQFCALSVGREVAQVHYTVVYGQLPALRELHAADADGNGVTSQRERDTYVGTLAPRFADQLELLVDGNRVPLRATRWSSSLPTEQGGFSLRVDVDFSASLPAGSRDPRTLQFENRNYDGQMGWHEIVVVPATGVVVVDTNAFSTSATGGLSEALQALPAAGPLDERTVHLRFGTAHAALTGVPLGPRPPTGLPAVATASAATVAQASWVARQTRRLVDSISAPRLDVGVAAWALLAALVLGAVHALSPGHGKTIVGAYLIGSRGTPRHALILGLTVTATHTFGVFLLGFATLYASRYMVPARLFPIMSLLSALLVLGMGLILLVQRGRAARRALRPASRQPAMGFFAFAPAPAHGLMLAQRRMTDGSDGLMHSHGGGKPHSHLPRGAAGEQVTLKGLLALGVSGGLVPCPSAMLLLLAAIALNKTAFGMVLVLVFSLGLAITLCAVGLAFLYARNRFHKPDSGARWPFVLPVLSAAIITVVGVVLCVGALQEFG